MTFINSAANDNIKRWRKISEHPRGAKKIGTTLAEGIHLAEVICQKRPLTRAVVVRENNVQSDVLALAERVAEATGAKLLTVTDKLYDAVCPVENGTGIMVEVAATFADRPVQPIAEDALYLDGVQDAGNMGTLIRTALAAGVRHIAASSGSAGFWAPKVLRAGMGAHFSAKLYDNVSAGFCRRRGRSRCTRRHGLVPYAGMGKGACCLDDGSRRSWTFAQSVGCCRRTLSDSNRRSLRIAQCWGRCRCLSFRAATSTTIGRRLTLQA